MTSTKPAPRFDRRDIITAHAQIESDYNVGGWLRERASNKRRQESTSCQLWRMAHRFGIQQPFSGTMTTNARAIYRALERRYGFRPAGLLIPGPREHCIAYAYPSSPLAQALGRGTSGCYVVTDSAGTDTPHNTKADALAFAATLGTVPTRLSLDHPSQAR